MGDVYQNTGLSGLGSIGIIRSGQPTTYQAAPSGLGGGAGQSGDLVDQAIQARRNYEAQRSGLINQLPYANRREAAGITANLRALQEDEANRHWEANQARITAHQNAMETDHQLKVDRDTEIDHQGAGMMQTLGYLESALRNGRITKDQHDEALLEAGQRFPMALRHPEASKHYDFAITQADRLNQFTARNMERQAGRIAGKYGVDVQTDPETGMASIPLTQQAALQTDRGKAEQIQQMNREMTQKFGVATGVSSLFNPVAPHTSPDEGKSIDLPYLNTKTGEIAKTTIPTPLFNQMKANFQDRYFNIVPQGQQAAPTTAPVSPETAAAVQVPQISSQADYDALPAGATFIHNGTHYQKPQPQASE